MKPNEITGWAIAGGIVVGFLYILGNVVTFGAIGD